MTAAATTTTTIKITHILSVIDSRIDAQERNTTCLYTYVYIIYIHERKYRTNDRHIKSKVFLGLKLNAKR